ncbi:protein kinase [Paenibacillus sp. FSL A5-0031]|uniref:protein kinase domain-containing protein n=1 Tax=Paenibacillus sp. FSL A5-0031 TaxID=1920420 RepID=UPI0011861E84|nr:protein kinase [Paenibacillus sp. FSL A5-0031]
MTASINLELKILKQAENFFGALDEQPTFESKHPELTQYLENDGYSIVNYQLQRTNVMELNRYNKNEKMKLVYKGGGSYADVHYYEDPFYNQTIALKRAKKDEMSEKELIRFKYEFIELQKLDSPYIVKVYSYNEEKVEYTMEYVESTLHKYIVKNNTKISISTRISIINQLFKAFIYIHSKGLLHRDISTANVLIKNHDDGTTIAKVSDFGLVKRLDSTLTDPDSSIKGSLNDPNLIKVGFDKYEVRHEVYALTQVINYVLTGNTKGGLYNRNQKIQEYLEIGMDPVINLRFSSINEMSEEFARLKHLIK